MHLTIQYFASPCVGAINLADIGLIAGQVIVSLLLLWRVLNCWLLSQSIKFNTKCALALMFAWIPFFCGTVVAILRGLSRSHSTPGFVLAAFFFLSLALLVLSVILAILGLNEMSNETDKKVKGKSHAIWAIGLVAFFLLAGGVGFVGFARSRARASLDEFAQAPAAPKTNSVPKPPPAKFITLDDLNFRLREPDRPWVALNAGVLNKSAKIAFTRQSPEVYFMIIPDKMGGPGDFTCDQLAEIGKAQLQSAVDSSHVTSEKHVTLNGLDTLLIETEASVHGMPAFYQHWYIVTNGFAYQLIGYGRREDRAKIVKELPALVGGFELLDPQRMAFPNGGGFGTNFVSPQYDYSIALVDSPWRPYRRLEKDFPQAEFGASRDDSCLIVIPLTLPDENPALENLATGLSALLGINYPDDDLKHRADYGTNGLTGLKYDCQRDINRSRFCYRVGILRGISADYLVAAWTKRSGLDAKIVLDDAFERVQFGANADHPASVKEFTSRELKTQGFVLNYAALVSYKAARYERALWQFRAAARANPAEKLYVVNALLTWYQLHRPAEALSFVDSQPAIVREKADVRAWQAYFQAENSQTNEALANYTSLFAAGYRDDTHLGHYVRLLNAQNWYADSLAAIAKYQKQPDSISIRLLEAETYRLKSDFARATGLLKQLHEKAPYDFQVTGSLAETALAAGSYNDALDASRDMVAKNDGSPYALYLKGRSEYGLKWYPDAKESFEAAAKLAPADKTIASYVEFVNQTLGEGNNDAIKETIDPVAFPPSWAKISPSVPPGYATNYGAFYLQRVLAISWKPRREYKSTEFFRVRMLDGAGVAAFSSLQRTFDPAVEQLFVNDLRVLDRDGQIVFKGNPTNYFTLEERSGDVASHRKVLNIPVPGLQPGYQLLATITHRQLGRLTEFPFLEYSFAADIPVRQSLVLLLRPATDVKSRTSPVIEPERLTEGLCWRSSDPLVARYEPLQPPLETFVPTLWLSDRAANWHDLATEYLAAVADRLAPNTAVTDQARKVSAQAHSPEAKIGAIAAYVQTNCSYKPAEFGRRARIPNLPAEVINNKYGDCKDHAVLLQQMLTAAGVPARLALVASGGPVEQDLPSLDQFNHMIVFVPNGKGLFIDATDKSGDLLSGSPTGLADRDAFILDLDNPKFAKIPSPSAESNGIDLERHLRLAGEETVICRDTITARGTYAAYLRNLLQNVPPASRKMNFEQQMGLTDVDLTELTAEPLDTPGAPLKIQCVYTLKKQFHRSNGQLSGQFRAPIERTYLETVQVDKRLTPFEIRVPVRLKSTITFEIPEGFSAELPPALTPSLDARFVTCTNNWNLDGHNLVGQFECTELVGSFKASDYAGFRETMSRSLSLLERPLIFDDVQRAAK